MLYRKQSLFPASLSVILDNPRY